MSSCYLLGVDIGTSETKGVLTDAWGRIVGAQTEKHSFETPHPGWFEQDPEQVWWGDFSKVTRRLIESSRIDPGQIGGVGVSGLGQDLLPVDGKGNPVREKAILYGIDTRSVAEIDEMNAALGKDRILGKTANALSTHSIGPKLLWLKKNEPQVFARAKIFVTASSFIVGRLTGNHFLDHHQASFWVPLYDFYNYGWNEEFCRGLVEVERLPQLLWPSQIAGYVTGEAARQTGLKAGTPVIAGTGDAFAESIGAGAVEAGQLMVMYGSTTCMFTQSPEKVADERLWRYHSYQKGLEGVAMCTSTSGTLTHWFRDTCCPDLMAREKAGGTNAFAALAEEAANIPPGSGGLIVLPYFSGERSPIFDPKARGLFFGLDLSHKRGHLFKAVLEGIGFSVRHNLEVLREHGIEPREIIAVGGGTKNPVWLQAVSDICRLPQKVAPVTAGAAYGDAFLAGVGIGLLNFNMIQQWISFTHIVSPKPGTELVYDNGYAIYRELYNRNQDLMSRSPLPL
jgi:xylulokinase